MRVTRIFKTACSRGRIFPLVCLCFCHKGGEQLFFFSMAGQFANHAVNKNG